MYHKNQSITRSMSLYIFGANKSRNGIVIIKEPILGAVRDAGVFVTSSVPTQFFSPNSILLSDFHPSLARVSVRSEYPVCATRTDSSGQKGLSNAVCQRGASLYSGKKRERYPRLLFCYPLAATDLVYGVRIWPSSSPSLSPQILHRK